MRNESNIAVPPQGRWRLRTRLAVGLGVLFLAVFALIAYSHFQYLTDKREARMDDMERVSQTVAASFDGLTHDLESLALSTAITLGDANVQINQDVPAEATQSVNAYLGHLSESHGLLRAIFVTDTEGRVVFDQGSGSKGSDVSDRPYIKALQEGAPEFWSEGLEGSQTGQMIFAYSRAIINRDGATTGYLVLAIYTDALASRLPQGLTGAGHISIIDNDGRVVLRFPENAQPSPAGPTVSDWQPWSDARNNGSARVTDSTLPFATGDHYAALTKMSNLGWVVGYTLPESAVEGSTTGVFLRDILLLGAIILAAFVVMWLFASQTVKPLTRLTEAAGSISRGESLQQPLQVESGNAEVSMLAATMEQMRSSIVEREDRLRTQATALAAIEHFAESVATELDTERAVRAITEAASELVDAGAAQLVLRTDTGARSEVAVAGPQTSLVLAETDPLIERVLADETVEVVNRGAGQNGSGPHAQSVLGVPVHARSGTVEGALLMLHAGGEAFTDYHRRLAEGLARWASIVLENAKLYAEGQELISELEKSNEAKNEFLGIVSHELRTPITTIYGGTLLLRLRRESLPEQAFSDMIVSISEEAERLHHLVQDLLTIARTELVTEPRPLRLANVIQATITDFSSTHKRRVDVQIEPDLPPALADSTYVRQVIGNLISNADKYTPIEEPIEIDVTHVDGEIVVRIKDNGEGVAEAELPQIFDSFYRSKDAVERASGSGLGLTVCKRLVEALGGRIWAQNRPEGGLEVGFTIKAVEEEEITGMPNGNAVKATPAQRRAEAAQTRGTNSGEA